MQKYKLVTIDFSGIETVRAEGWKDNLKQVYESYIKRCVYGFPDIAEVKVVNSNNETVSSFVNWRR